MTVEDLKQEAKSAADNLWARGFFKKRRLKRERDALRDRFKKVDIPLPKNRTDEDIWRVHYASMVRKEAVRDAVNRMLNPNSAADLQQAADRWLVGVRLHDEWDPSHLFHDKPRGGGQTDGSTNGRLLRKLIMATAQKAATIDPNFDTYRDDIKAARDRLNAAERGEDEIELNDATQNLFEKNERLNKEVASKLDNLLNIPGGSLALKKAIFLTQEKLRDPLGYKQKYARIVPFDENKWVKASRRFYTPAMESLDLPPYSNRQPRDNSVVVMHSPPDNLPTFGPDEEALIHDVGQGSLGECWLQSSAASLPRQTLGNMFSWRPSYGSDGVTTRLHDEQRTPIYIRTRKDLLGHDKAAHKALWPFGLESATAKLGRDDLRQFRDWEKSRDPDTGLPVYSVNDVYGNSRLAASILLTGQDPRVNMDVSDLNNRDKEESLLEKWRDRPGKGVVSFKVSDDGPGHAMTWEDVSRNEKEGLFGNPGDTPENKILNESLSSPRISGVSFLEPAGADPDNDMFVQKRPSDPHQKRIY